MAVEIQRDRNLAATKHLGNDLTGARPVPASGWRRCGEGRGSGYGAGQPVPRAARTSGCVGSGPRWGALLRSQRPSLFLPCGTESKALLGLPSVVALQGSNGGGRKGYLTPRAGGLRFREGKAIAGAAKRGLHLKGAAVEVHVSPAKRQKRRSR